MRFRLPLFFVTALIAASCGGGGGYSTGPSTNPGTNPGTGNPNPTGPVATTSVTVADNDFSPKDIQVAIGATVTWSWAQGALEHNVTFAGGPASANLKGGATFTRTFPTAGTFNYSCTLHSGMSGSVLVK